MISQTRGVKKILYRAADDDIITDCGSFAEARETAEVYTRNPGYGGAHIYRAEVEIDPAKLLDLVVDDPHAVICELLGCEHPGAIGADEWVPRISYDLREAGIEWVCVHESYPADTITWIYVGDDDIDMERLA